MNTLSDSFRHVALLLRKGLRGVQLQSPNGGWYASYNPATVRARARELEQEAERLEVNRED